MRIRQMGFSSRLKAHRHLLTLETLRFIVAYLDCENIKEAALQSGIPDAYASRQGQWLMKLPMVKRALEEEVDARDLRRLKASIQTIEDEIETCRKILQLEPDLCPG